jgi:dTDP-4-dehydrorhamnose 3,5-epimerase
MNYKYTKWNEFDVHPSKVFGNQVPMISTSAYQEFRGEIWTTYHSSFHPVNEYISDINELMSHDRFSRSYKGVLRGLHYDDKTWKLVHALVGDIYLVILDMREHSPTYGKWESYIISESNKMQVLVPPGFANGHYALTDCIFGYNLFYQGNFVDVESQSVVKWNDPRFNMEWPTKNPILSKRDGYEAI